MMKRDYSFTYVLILIGYIVDILDTDLYSLIIPHRGYGFVNFIFAFSCIFLILISLISSLFKRNIAAYTFLALSLIPGLIWFLLKDFASLGVIISFVVFIKQPFVWFRDSFSNVFIFLLPLIIAGFLSIPAIFVKSSYLVLGLWYGQWIWFAGVVSFLIVIIQLLLTKLKPISM